MSHHIFDIAEDYLGVKEYPAAKHNDQIVKFFADAGHGYVQDDETPWCAAFVGAVLAECGVKGSGKLNARSYMDWGHPVDIANAEKGDIVVFWRGSKDSWKGHVAFFSHVEGDKIYVLGGNQGNAVSVAPYPAERLLGVRRLKQPRKKKVQSKTVQASMIQVTTAAGTGVTAVASLDGTAQLVAIIGACVIAVTALIVMKERLLKWNAGDR
jgi:uncharacterized protein (TIGR02594 family)